MIFTADPGHAAHELQRDGYVHLKGILSDEFVGHMQRFLAEAVEAARNESRDWQIAGKKRQFVFEFPSGEAAREFRDGMARLTGLDPDRLTVSERHLKLYDSAAEPFPAPHKDRRASHYSVGLPVHLSPGSTVCIFPELEPGENTEDNAVFLDGRGAAPDLYDRPDAVMLNENVGDLVIFLGSRLYHERVRAAGTAVLYIKVNADGADPLGENIFALLDAASI